MLPEKKRINFIKKKSQLHKLKPITIKPANFMPRENNKDTPQKFPISN